MSEQDYNLICERVKTILNTKLTRRERAMVLWLLNTFAVDKNMNYTDSDFERVINDKVYNEVANTYQGSSMEERCKNIITYIKIGIL